MPGIQFLNIVISDTHSLQKENIKLCVQIYTENKFTDACCLAIKNASVILFEMIFIQVGNNQWCTNLGLQISTNFEIDTYILKQKYRALGSL